MSISALVDYLTAPAALSEPCAIQSPVSINGTALGSWGACCVALPSTSCLAVSIGIGAEWTLEDALSGDAVGCDVHAFDPTEALRETHAAHAKGRERLHFHYLGVKAAGQQRLPYGGLHEDGLLPLPALMMESIVQLHHRREKIDVLKLDCEGCEWDAFHDLVTYHPTFLSRVRILMVELHMIPTLGFRNLSQLDTLIRHVTRDHGFELYRRRFNQGFKKDQHSASADLVHAGFPSIACCIELHFVRRRDLHEAAAHPAPARCNGRRYIETDALFTNPRIETKYGRGSNK